MTEYRPKHIKLGDSFREDVEYQSGAGTKAPQVIFAAANYESGLGDLGDYMIYEDAKYLYGPAIVYVRADVIDRLEAEAARLRGDLLEAHERLKAADALAYAAQELVDWVHNDLGADMPNELDDLIEAYRQRETGNE